MQPNDPSRLRVAVIGAGPLGLAAADALAGRGATVVLLERDDRLGGMSAHVDFDGTRIERYYHFVCAPDETTFAALREHGLADRLRWVDTQMGFFSGGRLHDWGSPLALLAFPGLTLAEKIRYGRFVLEAKGTADWSALDRITSTEWIRGAMGARAYDVLWRSLFHHKFYEHEHGLSAAWLGARIRRVALSRRSLFQERLGYIEGGSEALLDAIAKRVRARGGTVALGSPVEAVLADDGAEGARRVAGVRVGGTVQRFDAVVSTVPMPLVPRLVPDLPAEERRRIEAIENVAVACVLLKLRAPFTRNFWLNVADPRIEIPGLVEYTNLNPLDGSHVVYAPFYMPRTHPKYARDDRAFVDETVAAMALIRPGFGPADVVASTVSRYAHAQPVCGPGFLERLPPVRSALAGLYVADTSSYYPEDRSISESLRLGAELGRMAAETRPATRAVAAA